MSDDHEHRGDSILAKIAIPVAVAVLIALIAGGTAPWWVNLVFPTETASPASEQPSETEEPSETEQPSETEEPSETQQPTFLGLLHGEWALETWQERPGAITLCFHPLTGSLVIDAIGHAYWDLDLDDCGPEPQFTPSVRCLGVVDAAAETLSRWTGGRLTVNGEDLIGEERNWTSNLNSLRGDTYVAFCGSTFASAELFVYDTTQSDYTLTISPSPDANRTRLLTMRNAAGKFTWRKVG